MGMNGLVEETTDERLVTFIFLTSLPGTCEILGLQRSDSSAYYTRPRGNSGARNCLEPCDNNFEMENDFTKHLKERVCSN